MSYHRVLPPPTALVNRPATASPWGTERDSLLQHKIMNNNSSSDITPRANTVIIPPNSPAPNPEQTSSPSPEVEVIEDPAPSPKDRRRSSSQSSNEENVGLGIRLPSLSWQGESPSQICLCQPDPKIPRPRNAFILYRQHHQATVVAQNPGLANPEISKVIGDHWRASSAEVKNHWKLLAEEEKIRHQKLYPDYRYQPRRNGRSTSQSHSLTSSPSTNEGENRRCPKCGGRSMTTPGMMSTSTISGGSANTPATPYSPSRPTPTSAAGSGNRRFPHGFDTPNLNASRENFRSRPNVSSSNLTALQLASPRMKRSDATDFPLSPELKRRRVVENVHNPVRAPNGGLTPFPLIQGRRRESLPRPDFMPPQGNSSGFDMAPPPRPNHTHLDSSLTLPPLQTATKADLSTSSQAKSVEAMVMSIPTLNKIRVLAKISPPLPPPGPASPPHSVRGFVVAVDGFDPECVAQITETLYTSLSGHHPVRVFETPSHQFPLKGTWKGDENLDTFQNYLGTVQQYHLLSAEIISYITTYPPQPSPPVSPSPISPKTIATSKPTTRSSSQKNSDTTASNNPPGVPVALVPSFQLSHSDASASRIPILDAYAPIDHWQWMATLWRGTVGPDVTVAIIPPPMLSHPPGNLDPTKSASGAKAKPAGLSGGSNGPAVEVRLEDSRAILVRLDGKTVSEGSLRRIGFEVGEWVRGREEGRRGS